MKIGYARVSTEEQNLDRQLDSLKEAGCEKIFQEKITGTKKERPELDKLMEQLRSGDLIIVSGVPSGKCGFTTLRNFPDF